MNESLPVSSEIRIGTSGYDYPEWKASFYPQDLARKDFLSFYSKQFDTVELNFSYYGMPKAGQLARLLENSGPQCLFSIKAHRSLTHEIDPAHWRDHLGEFRAGILPLVKSERLGALLLQFPQSFHYEPDRRRYLDALLRELGGLSVVVEFRSAAWYNNRVFDAFRERGVGIASLDLPDLRGLPPIVDIVTAPTAYLRFHGRNSTNWYQTDATARYDYSYSDEQLEAWTQRVKGILGKAARLLVYFNNHSNGQAARNAITFKRLLGEGHGAARPGAAS